MPQREQRSRVVTGGAQMLHEAIGAAFVLARSASPQFFAFMATDESGWATRLATMSFVVAAYFLK